MEAVGGTYCGRVAKVHCEFTGEKSHKSSTCRPDGEPPNGLFWFGGWPSEADQVCIRVVIKYLKVRCSVSEVCEARGWGVHVLGVSGVPPPVRAGRLQPYAAQK